MHHPYSGIAFAPGDWMSLVLDACSVWLAAAPAPDYRRVADEFPELPGFVPTSAAVALRTLFIEAGLDAAHVGTSLWSPLSAIVEPGMNVVVKPNWVTHRNASSAGWECLVTHPSLLDALCRYLIKARPARLTIGDAPVQGCDFAQLMAVTGTAECLARLPRSETDVHVKDFRLVTRDADDQARAARASDSRGDADYVRFDLAGDSLLEPITSGDAPFRVTMYDPRALDDTHARGRHRYLVARELIDADVVFNVPKLKTHKKAGVTGALKNLVGINGHKAYLPHHRKGGGDRGGDAYPGHSVWKSIAEEAYDAANRLAGGRTKAALFRSAALLERVADGDSPSGVEGSWHGNDTVWRMSLDLQRLLRYGRSDGSLGDTPAREIVSVTDAIVAGQGEGPLSPTPCALGLLTLGRSPAAVEWVHAGLMGFDPRRIPIVVHAFDRFRFPLAPGAPEDVVVHAGGQRLSPDAAARTFGAPFTPPSGWRGHCERDAGTTGPSQTPRP